MSTAATATATAIGKAAANADALAQQNRQAPPGQPEASHYDVWSHTGEGLMRRDTVGQGLLDFTPAGAAVGTFRGLTSQWSSGSLEGADAAIRSQASSIAEQFSNFYSDDPKKNPEGVMANIGAAFGLLTSVEQLWSVGFGMIPFPAFPALRILDTDIGLPHAHGHPPNLTPPNPVPVPLPSTGPVIPIPMFSGANRTQINGMPAARCGDMGLGVWCGGYVPMFEVFLGSATVWIEGARAARTLVDITNHCIFSVRPGDPPIGLFAGTTITGSSNVIIGGVPLPSMVAFGMAMAFRGLGKLLGAAKRLAGRLGKRLGQYLDSGFLKCRILKAEPVNAITGEVVVEQSDFRLNLAIPLSWTRSYSSHGTRVGACGHGWETPADIRLELEPDGVVVFRQPVGGAALFLSLPEDGPVMEVVNGAVMERVDDELQVRTKAGLTYHFAAFSSGARETLLRKITDRCGNYLECRRRGTALEQIRDSAGWQIDVANRDGLIESISVKHASDETSRQRVRYEYDGQRNLSAAYDAQNKARRFIYERHRLVEHSDRNSLSFYYRYDTTAELPVAVEAWGDGGLYRYQFEYDPGRRQTRMVDSLGRVSTLAYNAQGLPILEVDKGGNETKFEYDDAGRARVVVDEEGCRTCFEYDERGNLVAIIRPDETAMTLTYDEQSNPVEIVEPGGGAWLSVYDERGLLTRMTDPGGAVSEFAYDARGNCVAHTSPGGVETRREFDAAGRLRRLTNLLGETVYEPDELGRLGTTTLPSGRQVRYEYDAGDNIVEAHVSDGRRLSAAYDAEHRPTRLSDQAGRVTQIEHVGLGEFAVCRRANGTQLQYGYDAEERLTSLVDDRGRTYAFERDAVGQVVGENDYWDKPWRHRRDARGLPCEAIDPLGNLTLLHWDEMRRIVSRALPDGSQERYTYDAAGNLVLAENDAARVERRFDTAGRRVLERQGDFQVEREYDVCGNLVCRRTSLGNEIRYAYDKLQRLTRVQANGRDILRVEMRRDGSVAREVLLGGARRSFEYDAFGRLVGQTFVDASGAARQRSFQYDGAGNVVQRADWKGSERFAYDACDQLVSHWSESGAQEHFSADPVGDIFQGGRKGRYRSASYQFDQAGRLQTRVEAGRTQSHHWNGDRLTAVEIGAGTRVKFAYDAMDRRIRKDADRQTRFFWDGHHLLAEDVDGAGVREFVYYPRSYVPLAIIDQQGKVFYFQNDQNGVPHELVDETGREVWSACYDAWGRVTRLLVDEVSNPIRLQGQYEDGETGLHYNRFRYYDPVLGAFICRDPLGLEGGINVYKLAPNVWRFADPLGLTCRISFEYARELANMLYQRSPWMQEMQRIRAIQDMAEQYAAIQEFINNYRRATGINIQIVAREDAQALGLRGGNWGTYIPEDRAILLHEGAFTTPRVDAAHELGHEVGAAELDRVMGIPKEGIPRVDGMPNGSGYLTHLLDMMGG